MIITILHIQEMYLSEICNTSTSVTWSFLKVHHNPDPLKNARQVIGEGVSFI